MKIASLQGDIVEYNSKVGALHSKSQVEVANI
jgi:hypothetical protein